MGTPVAQLVRAPARRTGDLWFKSQLGHKFFYEYLLILIFNFYIDYTHTDTQKLIVHGLGHKSWQLFYFVDICEQITNVYVSYGMSAGIMSTHGVNTLSFRLYMSHFPTGLVSSKKNSCHDFCPNLYS